MLFSLRGVSLSVWGGNGKPLKPSIPPILLARDLPNPVASLFKVRPAKYMSF